MQDIQLYDWVVIYYTGRWVLNQIEAIDDNFFYVNGVAFSKRTGRQRGGFYTHAKKVSGAELQSFQELNAIKQKKVRIKRIFELIDKGSLSIPTLDKIEEILLPFCQVAQR
jgi:hypothetical protein